VKQTRLDKSGDHTGSARRIGGAANVTSPLSTPAAIDLHDSIDVIVAMIVDYYGNELRLLRR
jgi:hypothetical protein